MPTVIRREWRVKGGGWREWKYVETQCASFDGNQVSRDALAPGFP